MIAFSQEIMIIIAAKLEEWSYAQCKSKILKERLALEMD